jgi:hypothetical protein
MRLPRIRARRIAAWQPVHVPVAVGVAQVPEVLAANRQAWVERELRDCVLVDPDEAAQLRALVHGARCTCHRCR